MRNSKSYLLRQGITAVCILLLTASVGCESYDLGDEPTDNVSVDPVYPTWANGVGKLVEAKCASCHRPDRTQFTPANTPATMDNIASEGFFNGYTNGLNVQLVRSRTFDTPSAPMPPIFADQLSERESQALRAYLDKILEQSGLAGCPIEESTSLAYSDVAPTIAANCATAGCHESGNSTRQPLTTLEEVKAVRLASLNYVKSSFMPYGDDGSFVTSQEGADLLSWLCRGADVTGSY